jgi:hypothetical protein
MQCTKLVVTNKVRSDYESLRLGDAVSAGLIPCTSVRAVRLRTGAHGRQTVFYH